jgi:hypothetical protein
MGQSRTRPVKHRLDALHRPCELTDGATLRTFIKDIVNESRRHLTAGLGGVHPRLADPLTV